MILHRKSYCLFTLLLFQVLLSLTTIISSIKTVQASSSSSSDYTYHIIGVSGGLQDGFPDHNKLDYYYNDSKLNKIFVNEAIYIGRAYIRGYKAYLDVMQNGYRQYTVRSLYII